MNSQLQVRKSTCALKTYNFVNILRSAFDVKFDDDKFID